MDIQAQKKEKQKKIKQLKGYIQRLDGCILRYDRLLRQLQSPNSSQDRKELKESLKAFCLSSKTEASI
eukprot:COSAG01_NODE_6_length_54687_cov_500.907599_3_plen_68_part_00